MNVAGSAPDPIDVHVGRRIRLRRRHLGVTQEQLAEDLKLSFQQIQKYERGANRVSASKLYLIARRLGVGIAYFFEGLADPAEAHDGPPPAVADNAIAVFAVLPGALDLIDAWPKLTNHQQRIIEQLITEFLGGRGSR